MDSGTSHDAARSNRSGRRSQRMRLLAVYAANDAVEGEGLTDEEAGARVDLDHVAATRRISELRRHGWVIDTGLRRPTATGCMSMVCVITDAGWAVLTETQERAS